MAYKVEMLQDGLDFGRKICGLRLADLEREDVRNELRAIWLRDGVIAFRDSEVTSQFQIELSKVFGELEVHPVPELRTPGCPELITMVCDEHSSGLYEVDGVKAVGFLPWHFDLIYTDRINRGGVLTAQKISSWGGETGFIDRVHAYDTLPDDLKEAIENLEIVYQFILDPADSPYGAKLPVRRLQMGQFERTVTPHLKTDYPPVVHPMLFIEPDTGRRVLNVSPYGALYILGQNDPAGHALLERVIEHLVSCPAYYHSWKSTDMLLWDNWRMAHCVTPAAPDEVRIMQRTTIKGDYGLGRKLEHQVAA